MTKKKKSYSVDNKPITCLNTGCYFSQEKAWDMIYNTFPELRGLHINFNSWKYKWTEEEQLEQFLTKYSFRDIDKKSISTFYCVFDYKDIVNGIPNAYRIPDRHFVNQIVTDEFIGQFDQLAGLKFELDHSTNIARGVLVVLKGVGD